MSRNMASLRVEMLIQSALEAANGSPTIPSKDYQAGEIKACSSVDCAAIYAGAK